MSFDYKSAGVNIEAGEETVDRIKPLVKATYNEKVLSELGFFGGMYDAKFPEYKHPVLVASTDGVGTKLKVAFMTGIHNTVGQDLVNHCVNDILACGASPIFFLDYFGVGRLEPEVAVDVISGFAKACGENGCALIGGETAEMPSLYQDGEYDVSGTIVGVVDKENIVNGKDIKAGDILIGLESSGLHTNGYSLARAVLFSKYNANDHIESLGMTLGESLLKVHISYLNEIKPLIEQKLLKGISHITGGGIVGNTKRIIPKGLELDINWDSWEWLPIFKLIQETGNVAIDEMKHVFNLGIGMILVVSPEKAEEILGATQKYNPKIIGKIK